MISAQRNWKKGPSVHILFTTFYNHLKLLICVSSVLKFLFIDGVAKSLDDDDDDDVI